MKRMGSKCKCRWAKRKKKTLGELMVQVGKLELEMGFFLPVPRITPDIIFQGSIWCQGRLETTYWIK